MVESREARQHERLNDAYACAESSFREDVREAWYSFAGHAVRMRCVGRRLAERLAMPLSHLRCEAPDTRRPRLTIDLWDELETGVVIGPEVVVHPESSSASYFASEDGRFATSVLPHSVSSFDRESEHIVGSALGVETLSLYEWGRPLHVPLSLWYSDRGVPLVHSALVAHQGDGVLLAGPSAAGKTTSSLSCLAAGFRYLADDLAGLEVRADGVPWGHSVYGSAFVDRDTLARLPSLEWCGVRGRYGYEDKDLVLFSRTCPTGLAAKTRIRVVALVRLGDARTHVELVTKGEALLALARDALQTGVLSPGRLGFEVLAALVDSVPTFRLELGQDSADIPACVQSLLSRASRLEGRRGT